jgi:hypothetical protein
MRSYPVICAAYTSAFSFGGAGEFSTGTRFEATVAHAAVENLDFMIAHGDLCYLDYPAVKILLPQG